MANKLTSQKRHSRKKHKSPLRADNRLEERRHRADILISQSPKYTKALKLKGIVGVLGAGLNVSFLAQYFQTQFTAFTYQSTGSIATHGGTNCDKRTVLPKRTVDSNHDFLRSRPISIVSMSSNSRRGEGAPHPSPPRICYFGNWLFCVYMRRSLPIIT